MRSLLHSLRKMQQGVGTVTPCRGWWAPKVSRSFHSRPRFPSSNLSFPHSRPVQTLLPCSLPSLPGSPSKPDGHLPLAPLLPSSLPASCLPRPLLQRETPTQHPGAGLITPTSCNDLRSRPHRPSSVPHSSVAFAHNNSVVYLPILSTMLRSQWLNLVVIRLHS